jgi:hypothetical protein
MSNGEVFSLTGPQRDLQHCDFDGILMGDKKTRERSLECL